MASVVPQMRYRARVASAAMPELLDRHRRLGVPEQAARGVQYLEVKPELGVPSLYYATQLDASGERFDDGRLRGAARHVGGLAGAG